MVIGLGGNDAFTLNRPSRWRKHIQTLVLAVQQKLPSTPILFINMPPIRTFPAFTPLIQFFLGNLVEILGLELKNSIRPFESVYYVDRVVGIDDWKKRFNIEKDLSAFFSDGVHPSRLTYQTWAKDVATYIIENRILSP